MDLESRLYNVEGITEFMKQEKDDLNNVMTPNKNEFSTPLKGEDGGNNVKTL